MDKSKGDNKEGRHAVYGIDRKGTGTYIIEEKKTLFRI